MTNQVIKIGLRDIADGVGQYSKHLILHQEKGLLVLLLHGWLMTETRNELTEIRFLILN